ncbi:PRC-barrel domain-containing protein [Phormidesmis sp. 146-35]
MRKGSDVLGKVIVAFDTGKRIARVQDLIFDQTANQLLGFLVSEGGLFQSPQVVSWQNIQAIGPDAIVIPDKTAIVSAKRVPEIQSVLVNKLVLKGDRILTTDGRYLGLIVDLYFDEQSGTIEGYEASGGLFADAYSGRSFIPAPKTVNIGEDITFVPPETADLMAEQVGGIRGAVQTATSRIQESTEVATQRLQSAAQSASERLQQSAEETNHRLKEVAQTTQLQLQEASSRASDRFDQGSQSAAASITNALVSPEAQLEHVVGKLVDRPIYTLDGLVLMVQDQVVTLSLAEEAQRLGVLDQVYRATNGSLTAEINRQLQESTQSASTRLQTLSRSAIAQGSEFAQTMIEQAKGRRVQRMVRDEDDRIIAAPGQIVTDQMVDRAQSHRQEAALLESVGLPSLSVVRRQANDTFSSTGTQLREQALIAQENVSTLWQQLKEQFMTLQKRSERLQHQQRIESALGRPVTRVILDPQDQVILNVGEIITHEAVRRADAGGVLNILLNSVYKEHPIIAEAELRASEPGIAALERQIERAKARSHN